MNEDNLNPPLHSAPAPAALMANIAPALAAAASSPTPGPVQQQLHLHHLQSQAQTQAQPHHGQAVATSHGRHAPSASTTATAAAAVVPNTAKAFLAGALSGFTKLLVGHPFDTVKIRLQTSDASRFHGPLQCLTQTLQHEGVAGLFKGASPPMVGCVFIDSVMMGSLVTYRRLVAQHAPWLTTTTTTSSASSASPLPPPLSSSHPTTANGPLAVGRELSPLGHGAAGLLAGVTSSVVATPVEHLKARLQTQYHPRARRKHGPAAVPAAPAPVPAPTALARARARQPPPAPPTLQPSHWGDFFSHRLSHHHSHYHYHLLLPQQRHSASVATASASSFSSSHSTTSTQHLYNGPIDCARRIYRHHGVAGIYHGLGATVLFRCWYFVWWAGYDVYTRLLRRRTRLSAPAVAFWAGGLSAQTFWLASYPTDVVRQRIMTDPLGGALGDGTTRFRRWRDAAAAVYREGGAKAFYRGFSPCFLRALPANGLALVAFEAVMKGLPWG